MSYECPITFENVDSNVSRFSALQVSILVITYMFTLNPYILYFLAVDFYIRLFLKKNFSLIFQIANFLKFIFRMKVKNTDGGAKRLAGFLGLFFVSSLIILNLINLEMFSYVVALIFVFCSLSDALFNYCLGCKTYFIIKKIYPSFMT